MQEWEEYRQKPEDRDRCNLCGSTDDLMVYDGWGYGPEPLDELGTEVNLCIRCRGWGYDVQLAAVYGLED
jgi:hypothetical protein